LVSRVASLVLVLGLDALILDSNGTVLFTSQLLILTFTVQLSPVTSYAVSIVSTF